MIYLIIIAVLVIVGLVEFLIIKKGLKAGKKASSYIRGGSGSSPSNPLINKRIQQEELQQESFPEQEFPSERENHVEPSDKRKIVKSFPEQSPKIAADSSDLKREIRQKESPVREEKSALDMIQEIRGERVHPDQDSHEQFRKSYVFATRPEELQESKTKTYEALSANVENGDNREISEADSESEKVGRKELATFDEIEKSQEIEEVESPEEIIKSGLDLVRQGHLDEGIKKIEEVIEYIPEKADAYFNLGIAYTLKEDIPQAISAYQHAIEIDPKYGKAFFNLGTLHLKQGDVQEAIPKLEQAMKLLPDSMKALWNLYEAYRSTGLFTKALASLQKLIELEPDDASLYNHLGICYVKLGDYTKAIDSWKRSLELGALSPLIHYNLGKTYELYGEFGAAKEHYKEFLDLSSDTSNWRDLVSEVHDRLDNLEHSPL